MEGDGFAWADDHPALMVTVVRGLSVDQIIDRWGIDHTEPMECTFRQVSQFAIDEAEVADAWPWLAIDVVDDVAVVREIVTWQGARDVVLAAVAVEPHVEALAVYRNEKVLGAFSYASGGSVIAAATDHPEPQFTGSDPDNLRQEVLDAGIDLDDVCPSDCLVLIRNLLGCTVRPPGQDDIVIAAQVHPYPKRKATRPVRMSDTGGNSRLNE